MKYIIFIILFLFVFLIFRNYKKGLILFLIFTPIINNPALYVVNVKYLPLMTFWRFVYLFIILKYLSIFYFNRNQYWINNKNPFLKNFILIIFALFISSFINGFIGIYHLFSIVIEQVLLFIIIWNSFKKKEEIISVFKGLFCVFFIITLFGVYCRITNSNTFHTEILSAINNSGYREIHFGEYTNRVRAGLDRRVASLLYNPISYGGYLGMIFPFLLVFLRYSKNSQKLFYLLILFLIIINIFFTNSRSAIVILFFSFFFFYNLQNIKMKLRFMSIFIILSSVILFYPKILGPYFTNIKSIINISSEYDDVGGTKLHSRIVMLNSFIDFIKKRPFFGYGPKSLSSILSRRVGYKYDLGAENYFLFLIFNYGLFGFFAYLLFYYKIFIKYKLLNNKTNSRFQKGVGISGIAMLLSWIIFVNVTGTMNTIIFFTILVSLSIKFCSLRENKALYN